MRAVRACRQRSVWFPMSIAATLLCGAAVPAWGMTPQQPHPQSSAAPAKDAAASAAPAASEARYVDPTRTWSMVLPEGWAEVTPDVARELRQTNRGVPADLLDPSPYLAHFGPLEHWRLSGFDGRSLSVHRQHEEPLVGPELAADLPRRWRELAAQHGGEYAVVSALSTSVGRSAHPTVQAILDMRPVASDRSYRALQYYVPTGGIGLIFSFRTFTEDFAAAKATFDAAAATLTLARAARGERNSFDRLLYPLLIAAGVGLLLAFLSKHRHRAPMP